MLNFIIWIIAGALIGWLASVIIQANERHGLIADIIVGIVGAFVGGFLLSPLFSISTINQGNFSFPALLLSLSGAIILLAFSKLFRSIGGFVVILIMAQTIYIYVSCWSLESTSVFCTGLKALPFLQ